MRFSGVLVRLVGALLLFACGDGALTEAVQRGEGPAVCRAPAPGFGGSTVTLPDTLLAVIADPRLSDEQQRLLSIIEAQPPSAEVHIARLNDAAESLLQVDRVLVLAVSPTLSFAVRGTHLVTRAPADLSWTGSIAEHGVVQLVLTSLGVTASVRNPPGAGEPFTYAVHPLGDGSHAVVCVDESMFPPDH